MDHHHHHHHLNNTSTNQHHSSGGGGSTAIVARDHVYCLELAKRSVARAALHLGIVTMTDEVLNVLGDVLCEYLQRLGAVLAHNVENSGRSSQHVNVLDAIRAVELCTSPAVSRVHFGATTDNGNLHVEENGSSDMIPNGNAPSSSDDHGTTTGSSGNAQHPPESWQGLAAFCFGPTWYQERADERELRAAGGAGGKVGPKATQDDSAQDCQEGWRAPFPDEVPPFPTCSTRVCNPHNLTPIQVVQALYQQQQQPVPRDPMDILRGPNFITSHAAQHELEEMEASLKKMPLSAWGGIPSASGSHKAQRGTETKKKTEETTSSSNAGEESTNTGACAAKRKLEADDPAVNNKDSEGGKKDEDGGDKMDTGDDNNNNNNKDKNDDGAGGAGQPAKKKVKLEDGSAKAAKTPTTPKKKKTTTKDEDDDEPMDDEEKDFNEPEERQATNAKANNPHHRASSYSGPTYNYVPTFYPPIPTMATAVDAHKLRKTTVVDLLDNIHHHQTPLHGSAAASKSAAAGDGNNATTTTGGSGGAASFGLRTALVQLGSSYYWGTMADADPPQVDETSAVPVGRSGGGVLAPPKGPVEPLGRASGSRVSRILEGSMDAATMQQ